ncbi:mitochondrial putative cruciform cutting endonuclease 1 [Calycina marina]|uniref:Mitochondrial putative cruciform cutting endonuclease 1 n=1 Tax=Calycina marina TaxID=1763456 RepID=A0A9P8CHH4_9HELO|nr:mitochondrial putative cruciform cutting endonuclease 1 [Calycina marina]
MPLTRYTTLRLSDLKLLAHKCGTASSGTKRVLIQRLHDEIAHAASSSAAHKRVLSIDMGIRNLAYCILDIPAHSGLAKETFAKDKEYVPRILAWERLAVSTKPETAEDGKRLKEAFDPATLSTIAYELLRESLLKENPTHVLIERQRFRSMGGSHVLEWTLRVNMFESILHAVLRTLKGEGGWKGEVVSVAPGRVGPFWLSALDDTKTSKRKAVDIEIEVGTGLKKTRKSISAKVQNKGIKIDLVRRWLEAGDIVALGNEGVEKTGKQYIDKWDRGVGRVLGSRNGDKVDTGKLDDLADCLLQGMAWIKWEHNKRLAMRDGVEQFLDVPVVVGQNAKKNTKRKTMVS